MMPKIPKRTRRLRARAAVMNQHEADYEEYGPEPNMKLSHAFMVVLLLHVIAVGGLYAFNSMKAGKSSPVKVAKTGVNGDTSSPEKSQNEPKRGNSDNEPPRLQQTPIVAKTLEAPKANMNQEATKPRGLIANARSAMQRLTGIGVVTGNLHAATPAVSESQNSVSGSIAGNSEGTKTTNYAVQVSTPLTNTTKPYTVKSGDTMTRIAASLGVTIPDLEKANGLTESSVLRVGQSLKLPGKIVESVEPAVSQSVNQVPAAQLEGGSPVAKAEAADTKSFDKEYIVVKGDSPYKIAKKFRITPDELVKANGITDPKKIQIGQKLKIPPSSKKGGK